jgi:anti-anti-sigma regulatory factor
MPAPPSHRGDRPGIAPPPTNNPFTSPRATLVAASHAITGVHDLQALTLGVVESIASLKVDAFELIKFCALAPSEVVVVASWDARGEPANDAGSRRARASYPALDLVTPEAPFVCDDCANDPRLSAEGRAKLAEDGLRGYAVFPMVAEGEVSGALAVKRRAPHAHGPEEVERLGVVAQLASVGLANVESRAALAEQVERINALYRAGEALTVIADEESVLKTAAQLLVDDIGYVSSWIAIADGGAGTLRERAFVGLGAYPGRPPNRIPLESRKLTLVDVYHTGEPAILADALERAEAEGWGALARAANLRSVVYVPLRAAGRTLGVMGIGSTDAKVSKDEVTLLGTFANQLALTTLRAQMSAERERQIAAMEEANASQARLLETIRELSTPVIPVHDGILVVPLVGTIDSSRSAQIMDALLCAIQRDRATVVIIDVTGVPTVDTGVANHLLRSARAAALLGARCILVGISPVIAQTMVQLGVDLGDIVTRNNLQAGISYALALRSLVIRRA